MQTKRNSSGSVLTVRILLILAAVLLLLSPRLPYWRVFVAAPQYPKGLVATVYLDHVGGDVREINGLNHYIGMRRLEEAAPFERRMAIPGVWIIALCLVLLALFPRRWTFWLAIPCLLFPLIFAGDLYWWLRDYGLNLDPHAPLNRSVKPFIPPILGGGKIAQFSAVSSFQLGFYFALGATFLTAYGLYLIFRKPKGVQPASQLKEAVAASVVFLLLVLNISPVHAKTLVVSSHSPYNTLKAALRVAAKGDVILVRGGIHPGPVVVNQSVRIIGENTPVLDGGGRGTVIRLNAPHSVLRGFVIRNSGTTLSAENSGVTVAAPQATVEENRLENVLFGIILNHAPGSIVRRNVIHGMPLPPARRGDAIRVWYSDDVRIEENKVVGGRDVVLWFAKRLTVRNNEVTQGRYGLHFMYCDDGIVEGNTLTYNSVGAYLMYSRRLRLQGNFLFHNRGPSGCGVGLKDMEEVLIQNNLILDNRTGMFIDNAGGTYQDNLLSFNEMGIDLFLSVKPSVFTRNNFVDNGEQVVIGGTGEVSSAHWKGNYWSDYSGYDADGDGTGDVPYCSMRLFERVTDRNPSLRLFLNSPSAQAIDFASRLFPLFAPKPKLTDPAPQMATSFKFQVSSFRFQSSRLPNPASWLLPSAFVAFSLLLVRLPSRKRGQEDKETRRPLTTSPSPHLTTPPPAIRVHHLSKRFGAMKAVDDLSFEVRAGETIALWGPNGVGKTTVLRCLLGLLPFEGRAGVLGLDVRAQGKQVRQLVGYVPQEIRLHGDLTVLETLHFYAQLRRVPAERAEAVLQEWQLDQIGNKPVNALSGGMRQKLALVLALLSDPPVLLLDEPTTHLDVQTRREWRGLLERLKKAGKTLLFCTHQATEVRQLADRVLVLDKGRKRAECSPKALSKYLRQNDLLYLTVNNGSSGIAANLLQENGFVTGQDGDIVWVQTPSDRKMEPLRILIEAGIPVVDYEWESGRGGEWESGGMEGGEDERVGGWKDGRMEAGGNGTEPVNLKFQISNSESASPKPFSPLIAITTLMRKEIRDARHNRWFLLFALIFSTLALALSVLGLAGTSTFGVAGFGRTAASLVNLVLLIVPLMGLIMGAMSIASEREQHTLLTLLAQPVTPVEVLIGKFLGMSIALTAAILFGFGLSGLAMFAYGVTAQMGDYVSLVGFTLLLGLAFLSLGFCLSVLSARGAGAVGLALFIWLALIFLSDLGLMGTAVVLKLRAQQLLWLALLNPAQVFKLAVVQTMQGNLEVLGAAGLYATEVLGTRLMPVLSTLLLGWIFAPLAFALRQFAKRGGL